MTAEVELLRETDTDPLCTCTIDPDGARNFDGCVVHDFQPCGFLVEELDQ